MEYNIITMTYFHQPDCMVYLNMTLTSEDDKLTAIKAFQMSFVDCSRR